MRRLTVLLSLLPLLFAIVSLAACGRSSTDEFSPASVAAAAKKAGTVNGLCPIMKKPVIVGDFVEHEGEKIGFCCPGCSTQFLREPAKYLAAMKADPVKYGYKQP